MLIIFGHGASTAINMRQADVTRLQLVNMVVASEHRRLFQLLVGVLERIHIRDGARALAITVQIGCHQIRFALANSQTRFLPHVGLLIF